MGHLHERRRRPGRALEGETGRIGQARERQRAHRLDARLVEQLLADGLRRGAHGAQPRAMTGLGERGIERLEYGLHGYMLYSAAIVVSTKKGPPPCTCS